MNNNKYIILLCLILSALLSGCDSPSENKASSDALSQMVGETVLVQFRRDALGDVSGGTGPFPDSGGLEKGSSTTLVGKLTKAESSAIVVEANGGPNWIPREVILLVRVKP